MLPEAHHEDEGSSIESHSAITLAKEAIDELARLDGLSAASCGNASQRASVTRQLLYAAHLFDVARVEVLNQYHAFKGAPAPRVYSD